MFRVKLNIPSQFCLVCGSAKQNFPLAFCIILTVYCDEPIELAQVVSVSGSAFQIVYIVPNIARAACRRQKGVAAQPVGSAAAGDIDAF